MSNILLENTPCMVPLKELKPYEHNYRYRNDDALDDLVNSIKLYGYNVPIIINSENVVLAGHLRLEALKKLNYTEVLCIEVSNSNEDIDHEIRLLDNLLSEYSTWDRDGLKREFKLLGDRLPESNWLNLKSFFKKYNFDNLKKYDLEKDKSLNEGTDIEGEVPDHDNPDNFITLQCPSCSKHFNVREDE